MSKRDYYGDPQAPTANSLVVAVAVVGRDESGRVLLIERTDNDLWALPGGAQDIGETTRQAALREVAEETGLIVELTDIVGIYSDPRHVIAYDDGEVRQEFSIVFTARTDKRAGGLPGSEAEDRRPDITAGAAETTHHLLAGSAWHRGRSGTCSREVWSRYGRPHPATS
ncbi:ADP-ribose pyrophosphatase YjhB (NUDIX family) [Actinopolyspora lacussalsi]|nr:ADP-ribose pyrophosphatase YjhB (NUDIX family) [Actinopolyspora lacussalsi]